MFEMPNVRRDNGQIVNGRGCGNCGILKAGIGPRADRAIDEPTGFESGG